VYDKLRQKPDLTVRLTMEGVIVGKMVDLVPLNDSVACMATRAASRYIVNDIICDSPSGIMQKKVRAGQGMVTVKLEKRCSRQVYKFHITQKEGQERHPCLQILDLEK
jgi:hypothetical protein